jgi:ribosomal protein S1
MKRASARSGEVVEGAIGVLSAREASAEGMSLAVGDRILPEGASLSTSVLRGFVPLSHQSSVGNLRESHDRSGVPGALSLYLGKRLPLTVIEADQRRDRLILSEKATAQALRRRRKEEASHGSRKATCWMGGSPASIPSVCS